MVSWFLEMKMFKVEEEDNEDCDCECDECDDEEE